VSTKQIKIPKSQHARLKLLAVRKGMTLEELAAVAISFFLSRQKEAGNVVFEGVKPR